MLREVHISNPWIPGTPNGSQTPAQKFFEAYAHNVDTRIWGASPITKWYSPSLVFHSETAKIFNGAPALLEWLNGLFLSFERNRHIFGEYIEIPNDDGSFKVMISCQRQLWLKGNTGEEPNTSTPMAWHCTIAPSEGPDGYLGLQFKEVHLFWDKTKTVELLQRGLPSDA